LAGTAMKAYIFKKERRLDMDDQLVIQSANGAVLLNYNDKRDIELVETDNVWRIYITYTTGDVTTVRFDTTKQLEENFKKVVEWIKQ
jgi:hypothetical protein